MKGLAAAMCLVVAVLVSACGGSEPAPVLPAAGASCVSRAPLEQPEAVRRAVVFWASPPPVYGAVLGWVNATLGKDGRIGSVRVRNLRLWENANGTVTLISERIVCPACDPADRVFGYSLPRSQWQLKEAWFKSANEGTKFRVDGMEVIVPVAERPADVYHFWHTAFPRPVAKAGAMYFITADAVVDGDAMVQIGLDYWQLPNGGANVEAAVSDWHCAAPGVQEIRAGPAS